MVTSKVLDPATWGKMVSVAPSYDKHIQYWAKEIVRVLAQETRSQVHAETMQMGNEVMYMIPVKMVADQLAVDFNPRKIVYFADHLGLNRQRLRDGSYILWNYSQLEILRQALGVKE